MQPGGQTYGTVTYGGRLEEAAAGAETVTMDKWYCRLTEPLKEKEEVVSY